MTYFKEYKCYVFFFKTSFISFKVYLLGVMID